MSSPITKALRAILPFCLPASVAISAAAPSEGEKLFALKVKPLFAEKCMACHGDEPDKIKGDFDMRTRGSLLAGGESFGKEVVVPGKGEASYIYIVTKRTEEDFEMPPKEADKLTEEQTWWIRDWINAGAPWVDDEKIAAIQAEYAEGEQVSVSKALSDAWQNRRYETEKLWAYRPLKVEAVPTGEHPVDWFIDRRLATAKLAAAPAATPRELVRRMRFGLTGLPPTPEEAAQFERDYNTDPPATVRQFADQLMATPQYGEHFARHWLDVTRYADSAGFANDYARPNAWRYRDYVVRAFNSDKPYDDFVREQIAGDEMNPRDPEKLIATGFLRMGPWEQTAMSVFKETRQLWLDDVTDSVGQTFLAHAMQCAKCHDHKFDPIPTRDYYRLMAVFSTTQFAEREAPFLKIEPRTGFKESDAWVTAKIAGYQRQRNELNQSVKKRRKQETGNAKVGDNGLDAGDEASLARMSKNIERHQIEKDRTRPITLSVYTGKTISRKSVRGRIKVPDNPWGAGQIETDTILTGGDVYAIGAPVSPGALSAAESLGKMSAQKFPSGAKAKRRSALANWIVDEKNPLTARVIVNRVWAWHFGRGLAGNPNNFGGTGAAPTHPALLDYLAERFIRDGWSIKNLNRLIVTSEAYSRSSRHRSPKRLSELDPKLELYATAKPRRLSAEELRDAMLTSSGEMNPSVGGIPARPDINREVAIQPRQIMGGTASAYEPDPLPAQRNRRSLYAEKLRGLRDPFLETFNQPVPDDSCELRESSTVAPQALTLFNAEEVHDRALAFAARILKETKSDKAAIDRGFQIALSRPPKDEELVLFLAEWQSASAEETKLKPQAQAYPNKITRTVMAEKTGEPYDFVEHLPAYKTYVPDLQRSDVDARTRALAHLCLVLFNSNEFAYLD